MGGARLFNLILCAVWLTTAGALLAADHLEGRPRLVVPIAGGISAGWLALVLAAYNAVRWYLAVQTERADDTAADGSRLDRPRAKVVRPAAEPNPDFDFTDPPRREPPT